MIATKVYLDTESVSKKFKVLSNGFASIGKIFDDMAVSLCEVDENADKTDCSAKKETKND